VIIRPRRRSAKQVAENPSVVCHPELVEGPPFVTGAKPSVTPHGAGRDAACSRYDGSALDYARAETKVPRQARDDNLDKLGMTDDAGSFAATR